MAPMVMTVLGPVPATELGHVLPHEHLACDLYRVTRRSSDGISDFESVIADATAFISSGGGTIVDATPPDLGRRPEMLVEIALATGAHVVMGSGWYREPFYEVSLWETPTAVLAEQLVHDIEEGVDGVRPGIIGELGADGSHITPSEERAHRAAARAHLATGLPITTHAFRYPVGIAQLDLLEEEGVDPGKVAIGHADSVIDPAYHRAIVERGAFIGIDLIRGLRPPETRRQVRMVLDLLEAGHGSQILLSHDVCFHEHLSAYGGKGFTYVSGEFRHYLSEAGVSDAELDQIMAGNPQRFLSGESKGN